MKNSKNIWHQAAIDSLAKSKVKVFTRSALATLLAKEQSEERIPRRVTLSTYLKILQEKGELHVIELPHATTGPKEEAYRPFTRFAWGTPSPVDVALALRPRSYVSHGSAMWLNSLCVNKGSRVYVNQEQSPKPTPLQILLQASIDRAFKTKARVSSYVFRYLDTELVLLSGKNTGNFAVEEVTDPEGSSYAATNLERTLVDITVRPAYAGGVAAVLEAYRRAHAQISAATLVNNLRKTLTAVSHLYPYHQAIGFYLTRAGVPDAVSRPLRELGLTYDFYLDHASENLGFDAEWRIHYPLHVDSLF
jgi:predicted transcriptional regulator of viral defense system